MNPWLVGALVLVALVVLAAAVVVLAGDAITGFVQRLFRRPPRTPKTPGRDHYYRPYWAK
jgi:hypothetical protein